MVPSERLPCFYHHWCTVGQSIADTISDLVCGFLWSAVGVGIDRSIDGRKI
jgi:hypothetical protein